MLCSNVVGIRKGKKGGGETEGNTTRPEKDRNVELRCRIIIPWGSGVSRYHRRGVWAYLMPGNRWLEKEGVGGMVFQNCSANVQNSMYVVVGNNMPPLGGRGMVG